jgi:hypothetical protein
MTQSASSLESATECFADDLRKAFKQLGDGADIGWYRYFLDLLNSSSRRKGLLDLFCAYTHFSSRLKDLKNAFALLTSMLSSSNKIREVSDFPVGDFLSDAVFGKRTFSPEYTYADSNSLELFQIAIETLKKRRDEYEIGFVIPKGTVDNGFMRPTLWTCTPVLLRD